LQRQCGRPSRRPAVAYCLARAYMREKFFVVCVKMLWLPARVVAGAGGVYLEMLQLAGVWYVREAGMAESFAAFSRWQRAEMR